MGRPFNRLLTPITAQQGGWIGKALTESTARPENESFARRARSRVHCSRRRFAGAYGPAANTFKFPYAFNQMVRSLCRAIGPTD